MATYVRKRREEILRQALSKLERQTPIKSTGAGSVARAFTEAISTELGDYYDILDHNMNQSVISTASGRSLDLMGELYAVKRKKVADLVETDRNLGSFYFYLSDPYGSPITIPAGTGVYTDSSTYIGRQFSFETTSNVTLQAGDMRQFAAIRPKNLDSTTAAGKGTLLVHDFVAPAGVILRCTNPKKIFGQGGVESDDAYRLRIQKAVRTTQGGTVDSIRYRALGVPGVRDVRIRQAAYGLGTFEVLVTSETNVLSAQVRDTVTSVINPLKPAGARMLVRQPRLLTLEVEARILITDRAPQETSVLAGRARVGVVRYLNTLLPGDTIVYNSLIQSIMNSSEHIQDVIVTKYAPNGVEAPRKNYVPEADQLVIPGEITVIQ